MSDRYETIRSQLEARGQSHVLGGWSGLNDQQRANLLAQIEALPWDVIDQAWKMVQVEEASTGSPSAIEPPELCSPDTAMRGNLHALGEEWIAAGRVAAFTVAGGQGTRLGWNGPKGTYPATPVSGKPLFACFAEQLLATSRHYGVEVPWYILTSPENDAATRNFFLDNKCFGLERNSIMLCMQGTMPVFEQETGKLMLSAPDRIATSPDGHGGSLAALQRSGALADMEVRGVDVISYAQVDNPLARMIDPVFIGLHADASMSSAEATSKMVEKTDPAERVGVFARREGKLGVVEYSDLSDEQSKALGADGRLQFHAGNIAIHLLGRSFIDRIMDDGQSGLPWHRAIKAMSYWDPAAQCMVDPDSPNVLKVERFIFDVLGRAERPAVLAVDRAAEFAPIKNATGQDSPETSRRLQSDLHGLWLEQSGVDVPRDDQGHVDASVEISPLTAMKPDDLSRDQLPSHVDRGATVLL
ncbi:MAG: UTP--glucose-1-phosphate uridylyltransferase [Phycisphaerales bacterium]|nr:UTP--glucose-1-phosphate uridylyltransferase [Phycisphaerales bacterium]